jgi:hypothetical protein
MRSRCPAYVRWADGCMRYWEILSHDRRRRGTGEEEEGFDLDHKEQSPRGIGQRVSMVARASPPITYIRSRLDSAGEASKDATGPRIERRHENPEDNDLSAVRERTTTIISQLLCRRRLIGSRVTLHSLKQRENCSRILTPRPIIPHGVVGPRPVHFFVVVHHH